MKIVVKRKNRYAKVLKVNFYGKRIIGELVLFQFFKEQIPNGQNFHIHFIYFEDGNYHFSIKYFDSTTIEYVERRTYYNHVSTRKSTEKNFKNCTVEKRDRIPGEMLDMFMMEEPMKPWKDIPIIHNFGLLSANSDVDKNFEWSENLKIKDSDIVIDLDFYSNKNINFAAAIYSDGSEQYFDLSKAPGTVVEKIIKKGNLNLKLYALILEN